MRLARPCNLPRRTVLNTLQLFESKLQNNTQACLAIRFQSTDAVKEQEKDAIYQEVVKRLDYNRGIPTKIFTKFYSHLKNQEQLTDRDASLLLHICALGPFDTSGKRRIEIAEDIWSNIQKQGTPISTRLFNMRLKTYKGNRTDFDVLQEMNYMKTLGISPDRVTCSLLIDGFCEKSDLAGANLILDSMNELNFPVDVMVFNSFITGYLKLGQLDEAEGTLKLIESRNLTPNGDTYLRFAEYFAGKGDLDKVNEYIKQADEVGVSLHLSRLLYVYQMFVSQGYTAQAQEFLTSIGSRGTFRNTVFEASCQLIAEGYAKEGLQLYKMMPQVEESNQIRNGSFLILSMVLNNYNAKSIMEIADNILEIHPNTQPHRFAVFYANREGKPELVVQLLDLLKSAGHTLKVPYFIPAICHYRDQQNVEGIYKMTEMMLDNDFHKDDLLDVMIECVYPALIGLKQNNVEILGNIKPENIKKWKSIFFLHNMKHNGIELAMKDVDPAELDSSFMNTFDARYALARSKDYKNSKACVDALTDFFPKVRGIDRGIRHSMNEELLKRYLYTMDTENLNNLLDLMKDKGLNLNIGIASINKLKEMPEEIQQKVKDLCTQRQKGQTFYTSARTPEMEKMSKSELEDYKKSHPNEFLPVAILLNRAMEEKETEEVKIRLRELQVMNFFLNERTTVRVANFFSRNDDPESSSYAVHYFKEYQKFVGTGYMISIPLFTGVLLVGEGNIEGAVEMIHEASNSTFTKTDKDWKSFKLSVSEMFKKAKTLADLDALKDALLKKEDFITGDNRKFVTSSYMKQVLQKCSDDNELVARLVDIHQEHRGRYLPYMMPVLIHLINNKNVAQLKTVMDMGISAYGNSMFHHRLAEAFLITGNPSKALIVLQTPGLTFFEKELLRMSQNFVDNKNISALESLVDIAKNFLISREAMLGQLIKGHVVMTQWTKAVDVLNVYEEEMITPQKATVDLLVSAFQRNNQEIPAILHKYTPTVSSDSSDSTVSSDSSDSSSSDSVSPSPSHSTEPTQDQQQSTSPADSK